MVTVKALIVFYGVKTVRPLRLELSFFAFELLPFSGFYKAQEFLLYREKGGKKETVVEIKFITNKKRQ